MSERYKIEDAYFTEPEGLLRASIKITYGPEEPGVSYRLTAITSDGITQDFTNFRNERLAASQNKRKKKKTKWYDRNPPISTKDAIQANELGFDYRIAVPPKHNTTSSWNKGGWEYLYYGDYNIAFSQLDELAATDVHVQLEERVKDPLKGATWVKMNTEQRKDGQFGDDGFLPPNKGGLLD